MCTKTSLPAFIILLCSCRQAGNGPLTRSYLDSISPVVIPVYSNITEIPVPQGFNRISADSTSFGGWLRKVSLKKDKTVYLYNGRLKNNQGAQFAVLDISTGTKDLQQCADAIMRMRAEYLFSQKRFNEIIFTDNAHTEYRFTPPYSADHLHGYLQTVFGMCGSASLAKQLKTVNDLSEIRIGDVLIRGGFPGHAVIVMDVAADTAGKKIYMLAQSYMPAQDIHVLNNPSNDAFSPWYEVNDAATIVTPEYVFLRTELKRFW